MSRLPSPPAGQSGLPPGLSSGHFHGQVHEGDLPQVKASLVYFFIGGDATVPAVLQREKD